MNSCWHTSCIIIGEIKGLKSDLLNPSTPSFMDQAFLDLNLRPLGFLLPFLIITSASASH